MKDITQAIKAKAAQIKTHQADIEALQRASSALAGKRTAKTTKQPKPKQEVTRKRPKLSAAAKKAVSERMKKY